MSPKLIRFEYYGIAQDIIDKFFKLQELQLGDIPNENKLIFRAYCSQNKQEIAKTGQIDLSKWPEFMSNVRLAMQPAMVNNSYTAISRTYRTT
jgi:hypothetical protein